MDIKRIVDLPKTNTLDPNDIFLINHLGSTNTISFDFLNNNIFQNISSTIATILSSTINNKNFFNQDYSNYYVTNLRRTEVIQGEDLRYYISPNYQFGNQTAMNSVGDRLAISVIEDRAGYSVHILLYEYNGTTWTRIGQLNNIDLISDIYIDKEEAVKISINGDGNRIAVTIYRALWDSSLWVYDYNKTTNSFTQVGKRIRIQNLGLDKEKKLLFKSVSMNNSGNRITVSGNSYCRVYEYNGTDWIQLGQDIYESHIWGLEKVVMSRDGNRIFIPSILISGKTQSRVIKVYEHNGTNWVEKGQGIDVTSFVIAYPNLLLAINGVGDRLFIGAMNTGFNNSGLIRVYEYNGTDWIQLGKDIKGLIDGFSFLSTNTLGDRIAVGIDASSPYFDGFRIYQYNGYDWIQLDHSMEAKDHDFKFRNEWRYPASFGYMISMNGFGDRIAVSGGGAVHIFEL